MGTFTGPGKKQEVKSNFQVSMLLFSTEKWRLSCLYSRGEVTPGPKVWDGSAERNLWVPASHQQEDSPCFQFLA